MTQEIIKFKGKSVHLEAKSGYSPHVNGRKLCTLVDTGNGYMVKFHSHSSMCQDVFMSLDYSQAYYLGLVLEASDAGEDSV